MVETLVEFDDITRHHIVGSEVVFALKSVSCKVGAKDSIAVMGASGSGKSTLLSQMAGLDHPDFGTVAWPSRPSEMPLRPKYVSVSFQAPSLLPSLTVRQNVEVPLLILGQSDTGKKAAQALELLQVDQLQHRFPDEISGGQAQRVGLARAMVSEPRLLLADEPTGQLDQVTGRSIVDALLAWATKTGCGLVVATHDPEVARKFKTQWQMRFGTLITERM